MSKIVQECKEPKVEMYKPIWGLVFKCNGSGIQFKSIQFSQEYSNQRNMRRKKRKNLSRTQDVTEVGFNNAYVSETLNLQQLMLSRYSKNDFYTCRTWSLTQKWAAKPIGNTSDNTLKNMSDNTLKTRNEHYSSKRS
jgi:hypothetical protein